MKRYVLRFLATSVVLLLLSVVYYITLRKLGKIPEPVKPKIAVDTNWYTYTDSVNGFSFDLPKNSYIEDTNGACGARQGLFDDKRLVSIAEYPTKEYVGKCGNFTFRVYLSSSHETILTKFKDILARGGISYDNLLNDTVILNGKEFTRIRTKHTIHEINGDVFQAYYLYYDEKIEDVYTIYYDYQDKKYENQLEKMAKSITISTSPPVATSINPPYYNRLKSFEQAEFVKRQYDPKTKWFGKVGFPAPLTNLKDAELIGMKCTPSLEEKDIQSGREYSYYYQSNEEGGNGYITLKDTGISDLYSFLRQKDFRITFRNVKYCVTDSNREFVFYNEYDPARFKSDQGFKIVELKDGKANLILKTEMDGYYYSCGGPFVLTNKDIFYLSCGGGDMTEFASVQKLDIASRKMEQVYQCSQNFEYDTTATCKK